MSSLPKALPLPTSTKFQTDYVLTIAGGHFIHDVYSAFVAPLLPLLIERLSLTLTLAGSLTLFMQIPSLLNPFIGYLADRVNLRYFVILAPAATATLISAMGLAPNYVSLAFLLFITGISVAAFHAPAPPMIAQVAGNQVGKGMSLFMAAGELGRTVGPLLAVWAVSIWALEGIYRLAIIGWVSSIILYFRFRNIPARTDPPWGVGTVLTTARRLFIPLVALVFIRSFIITCLGTYLPTFLKGEGSSLIIAGGALSLYEFAGVGGALISGTVSDRIGRKPVLLVVMLSSSLLLFAFLQVDGWLLIPVLIALGLTSLSTQPVLLATVQDQLPQHRAVANGAYLAVSFLLRSIVTILIGMLGDALGLRTAFLWSSIIGLFSIPVIFSLPKEPASP